MSRKKIWITAGIVAVVLTAVLVTLQVIWTSGRHAIRQSVVFEAGDSITVEAFLKEELQSAVFAKDSGKADTGVPGTYEVRVKSGLFTYQCTAVVKDTIPPTAQAVTVYYNEGEQIEPERFVENIQDKTRTSVSFVEEPDAGPLGKPSAQYIAVDNGWDPTDPDASNPWR